MSAKLFIVLLGFSMPVFLFAQVTTGGIRGLVQAHNGEALRSASIRLLHEPSGTIYFSQSQKNGRYVIEQVNPGGPYTLEISYIGFLKTRKSGINISLGETIQADISLIPQSNTLEEVTVSNNTNKGDLLLGSGISRMLDAEKISGIPNPGRSLPDYLQNIPHAKLVTGNEGAISLSGQNNRYNAFFIDGALNNDVFGLAASGTNGGQAGISPLSMETIEQVQVMISPYHVSQGNFTGGAINAITRSGNNKTASAVYQFTSNEGMSGKINGQPNPEAQILSGYSRSILGINRSGPFKKNKSFYFFNIEWQKDQYPQPFSLQDYEGDTRNAQYLQILANTLKGTYHYDPGSWINNPEKLIATKLSFRTDWNFSTSHKMALTIRFTNAERLHHNQNSPTAIHFNNDGYQFDSKTFAVSLDLKSRLRNNAGNKLLITFTGIRDDRSPLGKPFPRVTIYDGKGAFYFGTDISSTTNLLLQKNLTLFDNYTFSKGKHGFSMGIDCAFTTVENAFIQQSFGNYSYSHLADFLTNGAPSAYQLGFSMVDENKGDNTEAKAKFPFLKAALFFNDECRLSQKLSLSLGIRLDYQSFLSQPSGSDSINRLVLPEIARIWDLQGAASGKSPEMPLTISPRMGFTWRLPNLNAHIQGGIGIFTGRMPLVWPGGVFANNGLYIGGFQATPQQLFQIRFRANPYQQWRPDLLGAVANREPINLTTAKLSMPSLLRSSLSIHKKINAELSVICEAVVSYNLQEIAYKNINLLPPSVKVSGPDTRPVYSDKNNARIPIYPDSTNPFDYVILLGNNGGRKGYSYNLTGTFTLKKTGLSCEASYHYGQSYVVREGTSSVNLNQWRMMESTRGRNELGISVSDFSPGHRVQLYIQKNIGSNFKKGIFRLCINYSGQSGAPFSYVYGGKSLTRDDGNNGGYELVYIPGRDDLPNMVFLPLTIKGDNYSSKEQREAFDNYIEATGYLNNRRGNYAERNGSRTPFTHRLDIGVKKDFDILIGKKHYRLQCSLDLFNLPNLVNNEWGRQYAIPFDNYALLDFVGFVSKTDFTPQFQFDPNKLVRNPWYENNSSLPAFRSVWTGQMGIKIGW